MHLRLFREGNTEDCFAAEDLPGAKAILVGLVGEKEAAECDDWTEVPDAKVITVDCDGTKVTKTAVEWANEESTPGVRFGVNY